MEVSMEVHDCIRCGFTYALPKAFIERRQDDHKSFYCPACKGSAYYPQKNDLEKEKEKTTRLRSRLEAAERRTQYARDAADHSELRRRATRGVATKLQKKLVDATASKPEV